MKKILFLLSFFFCFGVVKSQSTLNYWITQAKLYKDTYITTNGNRTITGLSMNTALQKFVDALNFIDTSKTADTIHYLSPGIYKLPSLSQMLAIPATLGTIVIRSDSSKTYILQAMPGSVYTNWLQFQFPSYTTFQSDSIALLKANDNAVVHKTSINSFTGGDILSQALQITSNINGDIKGVVDITNSSSAGEHQLILRNDIGNTANIGIIGSVGSGSLYPPNEFQLLGYDRMNLNNVLNLSQTTSKAIYYNRPRLSATDTLGIYAKVQVDSIAALKANDVDVVHIAGAPETITSAKTFSLIETTPGISENGYRVGQTIGHFSTTSAANQKINIILPNLAFYGYIDISVSGDYNGSASQGLVKKRIALVTFAGGGSIVQSSKYIESIGGIATEIAISDVMWDAGTSKYIIKISTSAASNFYSVAIDGMTGNGGTQSAFLTGATLGIVYTTDATFYPAPKVIPSNEVDTVQTITNLENYNGSIYVNTIVVKDDNRGGIFNYMQTGTPDSCTVFHSVKGGYWKRQYKGAIHLLWSGADNTSSFDNTAIINYLLQTGLPSGAILYVDNGTYKDTGLVMTRPVNIVGESQVSTFFSCSLAGKDGLTIGANCSNFTIRDIAFQGNGTTVFGSDATNGNGIVINTGAGISAGIYFNNVLIWHNGGDGVHSDNQGNFNNVVFNSCLITNNKGAGVHLIARSGTNQINAITFKQCAINNNSLDGMQIWGVSFDINNNDIESNKRRAILIDKRFLSVNYNLYNFNIAHNHFEGNDSGFVYMNIGSIIAYNTTIVDNYGLYDSTPGGGVAHAGINLYEFNSAAIANYTSSGFIGLTFSSNWGYPNGTPVNSTFNGNNILGYAATVAPAANTLSQYINMGGAMVLYGNTYPTLTGTQTFTGTNTFNNKVYYTTNPTFTSSAGADSFAMPNIKREDSIFALKAPLASPALTGIPTAPTAATGTNSTQITTTAYVKNNLASTLNFQYDLGASIDLNTLTTTGWYSQGSDANAASGSNYPKPLSGKLEVFNADAGVFIYQTYHTYGTYNKTYTRTYFSSTWKPWAQTYSTQDTIPLSNLAPDTTVLGPGLSSIVITPSKDSIFPKQRIYQAASTSTLTPNMDTTSMSILTTQAASFTIANPTGATPDEGRKYHIRIKDNGTSQGPITWGTMWRGSNVMPLPTATIPGQNMNLDFRYNAVDGKLDIISPTNTILSGSYSATGTATTAFVVTFGGTEPNTTYVVNVTPTNALSAANLYVVTKTTTSFTVTYLTGLTGTVAFDWALYTHP